MTELEQAARTAWTLWGTYGKWTFCRSCGEERYCRADRRRIFLCLDCYDQRA